MGHVSHSSCRKAVLALENDRFYLAALAVLLAAVTLLTIRFAMWGDLNNYYVHAGDVLDGLMPYSEAPFEYPPLALVFMLVPRMLSWDLDSFYYICTAQALVFIIIGAFLLERIAVPLTGCRWRVRLVMLVLVAVGSYFLIARNDIYPTVIAVAAVWMFQNRRVELAALLLALAAMIKLYPAIFLLPMVTILLLRRDVRGAFAMVLIAAATCLLVELPFLLADPSTAFSYLTYHSDRGLQVESVAGGFFLLYGKIFPSDIYVAYGFGSDNVVGVAPDALASFMNPLMGGILLVFVVLMGVRIARAHMGRDVELFLAGAVCTAMVMLFIAFSKVYSAQYVIWILLLIPFTQASCFDEGRRNRILMTMLPFGLFTFLSYSSYHVFGVLDMNWMSTIMIFVKNIFHIVLTMEIADLCWNGCRASSASVPAIRFRGIRWTVIIQVVGATS